MKCKYLFYLIGIWLLVACDEDKGNYNYTEINEVSITDLEKGKLYTKVAFVDHLIFNPEIQSTTGKRMMKIMNMNGN